jgi:hypothetical protein
MKSGVDEFMKDESVNSESLKSTIQSIWASKADEISEIAELDEDCGPTKTCKNMKEITFEGFAGSGGNLAEAWKATLVREGKLKNGNGSIKEIVLGSTETK